MKKKLGLMSLLIACGFTAAMLLMSAPVAADDPGDDDNGTCVGDLNGDGQLGIADLLILLGDWGCVGDCAGDVDGNGVVNVLDLLLLLSNWGPCNGVECDTAADCDDGDPCTINGCIAGNCFSAPSPLPQCQ